MQEGVLLKKSRVMGKLLAIYCRHLQKVFHEYIVTQQLYRSGTSVMANIEEGNAPLSRKDFILKLSIARKELSESITWLDTLKVMSFVSTPEYDLLMSRMTEVFKLLNASIHTSKQKLKNGTSA